MGCSPWGLEESDTTKRRHFHFSLSCIGEGNGNPLQCSCLENPRDWGAWWEAVYGVAQSQARLKRLSSRGSRLHFQFSLFTFLLQCMKVKSESEVTQSYMTLSDPMDCSLPGSSVHSIFQARVLEWGAIAFSEIRA